MKKTSLFAAIFAAGAVFAAPGDYNTAVGPDDSRPCYRTVGLDFAYPIGVFTGNAVNNLGLNLFYGKRRSVYGIDLGLVSRVTGDVCGLQVNGGAAWIEGGCCGIGVSGLFNVRLDGSCGIDIASALNYTKGEFAGIQIALVNIDGEFGGGQIGVYNHDRSGGAGFQLAVANAAFNDFYGWSLGVVNCAERFAGLQLGVVNYAAENASGLQLGVFNGAKNLAGVQIGVLNLISTGAVPVLPVMNAQF